MLTAIATSMITVAGVVFSVTIVALSLAASQYSPRILRTFISDRPTQLVLGVFVGVYAYCLTVLRTIRSNDGADVVPPLAVFGGLLLALTGIGFLVYFIHHLAESIQAAAIIAKVTASTMASVERAFPEQLGSVPPVTAPVQLGSEWTALPALRTGYVTHVDNEGLLELARSAGRVLQMQAGLGDFVIEGQPLACLEGRREADGRLRRRLDACYTIDIRRTIEQDVAFGLQQLVDVASKALSPSINDASTALLCIDRLTQVLTSLARRELGSPYRYEGGRLLVVARAPSFDDLVELAYFTLQDDARGKPGVLMRLLESIERVAGAAPPHGRGALERALRRLNEHAQRSGALPADGERLAMGVERVRKLLASSENREPEP
jgi:uncharacterized membrane protein